MLVAAPLWHSLCKFCQIALESGRAFLRVAFNLAHFHSCNGVRDRCSGEDEDRCPRLFGDSEGHACHNVRLFRARSEEHTSELQSHLNLVCRLLLEKKKKIIMRLTGQPSPIQPTFCTWRSIKYS